jgi:NADH-quinone oxidoreductase subunit L
LFYVAAAGAAITAFYMFRMWYMTFAGQPREEHVYEHAHESPKVMYVPLVVLAVLAATAGLTIPFSNLSLTKVLEQARPAGLAEGIRKGQKLVLPPEHELGEEHPGQKEHHDDKEHKEHAAHAAYEKLVHVPVSLIAFTAALIGFVFATMFYGLRKWDPKEARQTFGRLYDFVRNKWWFDELYDAVFVRPVLKISTWVAALDRKGIDWVADNLAHGTRALSRLDDWIDRLFVDGAIDWIARWTYRVGLWLRTLQTGQLRQYVMLIVVGTVALFVLMSLY